MYGLYVPPPTDRWLQNNQELTIYDLYDFQCVKYQKLPVQVWGGVVLCVFVCLFVFVAGVIYEVDLYVYFSK